MPKIHTNSGLQSIQQSLDLEKAFVLLSNIRKESLYAQRTNLSTGKTTTLKHLPLTDRFRVHKNNSIVDELRTAISCLRQSTPNTIEKNIKSLITARENAAELAKASPLLIKRDPEGMEHVTEFFRALFHYLDRLITWVLGAEKTCAETYTPGAQTLTGKPHFFNQPKTTLGTALAAFEHACNNLPLDEYQRDAHEHVKNTYVNNIS